MRGRYLERMQSWAETSPSLVTLCTNNHGTTATRHHGRFEMPFAPMRGRFLDSRRLLTAEAGGGVKLNPTTSGVMTG